MNLNLRLKVRSCYWRCVLFDFALNPIALPIKNRSRFNVTKDMKKAVRPIVCVACIILSLPACEKQRENHHSSHSIPSKLDRSSNSFATEMTQSILSKKEFDDPADGYFHAYLLMRGAEKATNQQESIRNFEEALGYLVAVNKRYPDWKPAMVAVRTDSARE